MYIGRVSVYERVLQHSQYYSHITVKNWDTDAGTLSLLFFSYETRQPTEMELKINVSSDDECFTVESVTVSGI